MADDKIIDVIVGSGSIAVDSHSVDIAETCGGYAWGILHHVAESFPCKHCAEEGQSLLRFAHDLVNVKLGKPLQAPDDAERWIGVVHEIESVIANHPVSKSMKQDHLSDKASILDVSGSGEFIRERWESPSRFHPDSFRTIDQGDHRLLLGCVKGQWEVSTKLCKVVQTPQSRLHPLSERTQLIGEAEKRGIPIITDEKAEQRYDGFEAEVNALVAETLREF